MKPILIFQGEHFETSEKHKRIKNLFIGKYKSIIIKLTRVFLSDFFHQRHLAEANITELKRVMIFTCRGIEDPIEFRHLECDNINESTV